MTLHWKYILIELGILSSTLDLHFKLFYCFTAFHSAAIWFDINVYVIEPDFKMNSVEMELCMNTVPCSWSSVIMYTVKPA